MRIAIVAGEASGDLLAAGLIRAVRARHPEARFEGVAGPAMVEAGCEALFDAERLAVMGLVEVLGRYRELSAMRRRLARRFIDDPPDLFIGVDAPDFNLGLERRLKEAGIPTVHYVSPSVWAWRQYRVRKIARSVDRMLTLFPFEADFYRDHGVPVTFVGHPLADMIPLQSDRAAARRALGLAEEGRLVALLPGSRVSEVEAIGATMVEAAARLRRDHPDLHFAAPLVNEATRRIFEEQVAAHAGLAGAFGIVEGRAREVMAAADVVMVASGTATLEAMLLKRPMVVAYRLAPLTYWLARRLVKTPYVSLPNLLAGRKVVEELIQEQATPGRLAAEVERLLDAGHREEIVALFDEIHRQLRRGASERAADAVLELIEKREGRR